MCTISEHTPNNSVKYNIPIVTIISFIFYFSTTYRFIFLTYDDFVRPDINGLLVKQFFQKVSTQSLTGGEGWLN